MAKQEQQIEQEVESVPSPYVTQSDLAAFGKEIANGITAGFQSTVRPKVTIGQYVAKHRRYIHLNKEVYQNGGIVREHNLTDGEIKALNKIHRPGRYIDRRVEVVVKNDDTEAIVMWLRYSDKSADQRFENAKLWKNFEDLCNKIVMEQDVIEENERLREEKLARL